MLSFFNLFDYTVYSFKDLSGAIAHPLVGSFVFTEGGVGQISIGMSTDKTYHEIGVDGSVIIGKIPASNGQLQIQCHQTSNIHKWLLYSYNTIFNEAAEEWGKMAASLRNITDKTSHTVKGISFQKIPDKIYAQQGNMIIWTLMAAHIVNESPNTTGTSGGYLMNKLKGLIS